MHNVGMGYEEPLSQAISASSDARRWWRLILGLLVVGIIVGAFVLRWQVQAKEPPPPPSVHQDGDQNQGAGTNNGTMNQSGK